MIAMLSAWIEALTGTTSGHPLDARPFTRLGLDRRRLCAHRRAAAQMTIEKPPDAAPAPSKFCLGGRRMARREWLPRREVRISSGLVPITEPAVGYGDGRGAGVSQQAAERHGQASAGRTSRSRGDSEPRMRSWAFWSATCDTGSMTDSRREVGFTHMSANLDFHGIGQDARLDDHPLRYNLEPTGGSRGSSTALGDSTLLGRSRVRLRRDARHVRRAGRNAGLPDFKRDSNVGGLTPSFTYDTRDNLFTPLRSTFFEAWLVCSSDPRWARTTKSSARAADRDPVRPIPPRVYFGSRRRRSDLQRRAVQSAGPSSRLVARRSCAIRATRSLDRGRAPLAVLESLQRGGLRRLSARRGTTSNDCTARRRS